MIFVFFTVPDLSFIKKKCIFPCLFSTMTMERQSMNRIKTWIAAIAVGLLAAGCTRTVIPEEVLQLPEYTPVYTSYNLWANENGEIPSANVQKGTIIPFGTEITFVNANEDEINFKRAADGKTFKLIYDKQRNIIPIETFIKRLFVLDNEEMLTAGIRPVIYEKIKRGVVEKGMTRNEVLLAFGPPPAMRTPSEAVDTWTYWTDYGITKKIVFFGNRVVEIIDL